MIRLWYRPSIRRYENQCDRMGQDAVVDSFRLSDGEELHVKEFLGTQRSVLLCHSLASCSDDLAPLAEALASRGHRVVVFDQRGHGSSTGQGEVTMRRLALDVLELKRALELERPVAVGHSSGGYALFALTPEEASEFDSLVTVGTSPALTSPTEKATMAYARSRVMVKIQRLRPVGLALVRRGAFGSRPAPGQVEQVWRSALACKPSTRSAFVAAMLRDNDLGHNIPALPSPVISVRGSRDRVVSRRRALEVTNLAANGHFVEIDGAGHMVIVERPDAVAKVVADIGPTGDAPSRQ